MDNEANMDNEEKAVVVEKKQYGSVMEELKAAKEESTGHVGACKAIFTILVSTIGCTICIGFMLVLPISMIVIGSMYLKDCTIQRYIPIYLIVGGVFTFIRQFSSLLQRGKNQRSGETENNAKPNPLGGIIDCFLMAWFIAGNVWVYSIFDTVDTIDTTSVNYCNPTVYFFTFGVITATYILMGLGIFCCCCICFSAMCCSCFAGDSKYEQK